MVNIAPIKMVMTGGWFLALICPHCNSWKHVEVSIVMVVPQARWMVYFMGNPIVKWMMTRGVPLVISWFVNCKP